MVVLPVAGVAVGAGTIVLAEQNLGSDTARAVVLALAVLAAGALGKWLWKAILRQMRSEIQAVTQTSIDELGVQLGGKIDVLSARNDDQHRENGERLGALEDQMHEVRENQAKQAGEIAGGAEAMRSLIGHLSTLQSEVASLRTQPHPA